MERSNAARSISPELAEHMPPDLDAGVDVRTLAEAKLDRVGSRFPHKLPDLRTNLRHLVEALGKVRIVDLTPVLFIAWVSLLVSRGYAEPTIRKLMNTARALLEDAIAAGLIVRNPARIPRGHMPPRQIRDELEVDRECLSPAEIAVLLFSRKALEEIPGRRRLIYALLLFTGARFGEIAALAWRDIRAAARLDGIAFRHTWNTKAQVFVPITKSGAARHVPIHPALAWYLNLCVRGAGDELVAPRIEKGGAPKPLLETMSLRHWYEDLALLGLPRRKLHRTRDTFINLLRRAGANPEIVKRFTHAPRSARPFEDVYTHFDWDERCDAILKLEIPELHDGEAIAGVELPNRESEK